MEIRALDPNDGRESTRWYASLYAGASAGRVAPLVVAEGALLTSLRTNDTNLSKDRQPYGAWEGDTCIGTLIVELPRTRNTHLAQIDVNVPPEHRHRGIGGALFDHARTITRRAGRTTFHGQVNVASPQRLLESPGGRFAAARGFASMHVEHRLTLDIPVLESRLAELEAYAREAATGYRVLAWLGVPPEEWLGRFAEMHTLMDRDAPSGELDLEPVVYDAEQIRTSELRLIDQGYALLTTLILDADESPVAYTTMFATGTHVIQDDTFVLRAHRGHRLGTLAKVANLRQLAEHHPDARNVHTWTAEVNDAMRSINDRFGFRDVETLHEVELIAK